MYEKQRVIDIALAEVGYLEKAGTDMLDSKIANAGQGNYTKYSRDLAQVAFFNGRKQGVAWCAVFVAWCFFRAYGKEAALELLNQPKKAAKNAGAGCRYAMNYFKAKGRFYSRSPESGDVIFFYSADGTSIAHMGLVYKAEGGRVYTVEGNTSAAQGVADNGGGVWKKSYAADYGRIVGYGRPEYGGNAPVEKEEKQAGEKEYAVYTVEKGDSLWKIAKKLLGSGQRYTEIAKENGLTGDLIRIGQKLKIPR